LEELKEKTDNFGSKSLVGEGSYGRVYYAVLSDGQHVAIKNLMFRRSQIPIRMSFCPRLKQYQN